MTAASPPADLANQALARVLTHAIAASGRPRHIIATECGMHRETLLRVARGDRAIGLDEAARVLGACGAWPRASLILLLAGEEDLAREWMHGAMGEFLEEFLAGLAGQLQRVLGRRVEEIRPKWAGGTAQLVSRLLAKHIDDVGSRDITTFLNR
ncbi:transcriptional regulator [Novosphingobium piscinae]|uniref:Transcriptional regulator n=1 Tax=Novosphingobium piscinae TaxID=1507448 RepID=A0A7X1FYW4_9SPHN|nr:transcriptional regulator [Novosphingobium piscinae]MBC2669520.1 transcriptional regulator [Novosphingobium piscinae]